MWVFYSLLTAFSLATSDTLTKRMLASRDEYYVAWARLVFCLPPLALSFLFIEIPSLDRTFWAATFCALPLEILAIILYTKALKVSPISLTVPFLALTPLFLIGISYIVLGERVSLYGGIGILLMAAGSYALNLHKISRDLVAPFKAIFREKGSLLMIAVAFIYSFTSSLGKLAIEHSSPVFFGSFYFVLVVLFFTPVAIARSSERLVISRQDITPLLCIGLSYAMMIIFHMIAISMTQVSYMISVKRMSLFFSIFYGYLIFKEKNIRERTLGSIILFSGFLIIVLGTN
ncbi:MAG: EamA family transporter [Nitrospiraceae bacterium]|nr:MAG: EamA family transporter [Nitrospiraceae bacterium]